MAFFNGVVASLIYLHYQVRRACDFHDAIK